MRRTFDMYGHYVSFSKNEFVKYVFWRLNHKMQIKRCSETLLYSFQDIC